MKTLISVLLFFSVLGLSAQTGRLTLHGKVKTGTRILGDVDMELYQNNELLVETKNQKNGSFKLDLKLGSIYSITYKKEGYIDKSVAVIAKSDSTINGRYFFQLDIDLYPVGHEGEDESLLPPVAKLYIKEQNGGFKYDKKYVRWVAGEYNDLDE